MCSCACAPGVVPGTNSQGCSRAQPHARYWVPTSSAALHVPVCAPCAPVADAPGVLCESVCDLQRPGARRAGALWQQAGASSPGSMDAGANGVWRELAARGSAPPRADAAGAQASREASVALSDVEEDRRGSDSDFAVGSDGGADDPCADADNSAADSLGSSGYGASYGCGCACWRCVRKDSCIALQRTRRWHPFEVPGAARPLPESACVCSTVPCSPLRDRLRPLPHPEQEVAGQRQGQSGQARAGGPQQRLPHAAQAAPSGGRWRAPGQRADQRPGGRRRARQQRGAPRRAPADAWCSGACVWAADLPSFFQDTCACLLCASHFQPRQQCLRSSWMP